MEADPTPAPSESSTPDRRPSDPRMDDVWREHHSYLVGIASKMLRDPAAAEDVVQEAFGRLLAMDLDEIDDVRGWLVVVVRRRCLNRIKSAYTRREAVAGSAPPEPGGLAELRLSQGGGDPVDRVTLDDQVQQALAVVLDRLSPAERTSFVLHDVFGFPFAAIAEIVGRTSTACRQLASRARRAVRSDTPLPHHSGEAPEVPGGGDGSDSAVAERFIAACAGGDIAELVALLDPEVSGEATLIGGALLGHFRGADAVAAGAIDRFGPETGAVLVPVPVEGAPGIVAIMPGRVALIRLEDVRDGLVGHIRSWVLPPGHRE